MGLEVGIGAARSDLRGGEFAKGPGNAANDTEEDFVGAVENVVAFWASENGISCAIFPQKSKSSTIFDQLRELCGREEFCVRASQNESLSEISETSFAALLLSFLLGRYGALEQGARNIGDGRGGVREERARNERRIKQLSAARTRLRIFLRESGSVLAIGGLGLGDVCGSAEKPPDFLQRRIKRFLLDLEEEDDDMARETMEEGESKSLRIEERGNVLQRLSARREELLKDRSEVNEIRGHLQTRLSECPKFMEDFDARLALLTLCIADAQKELSNIDMELRLLRHREREMEIGGAVENSKSELNAVPPSAENSGAKIPGIRNSGERARSPAEFVRLDGPLDLRRLYQQKLNRPSHSKL